MSEPEMVERGDLNTWVWCGSCGAATWGVPPHGEGNPCPLITERLEWEKERARESDEVYLAKLGAERDYWLKAADHMPSSLGELFKRSLR